MSPTSTRNASLGKARNLADGVSVGLGLGSRWAAFVGMCLANAGVLGGRAFVGIGGGGGLAIAN
jgi:hypothetical protein